MSTNEYMEEKDEYLTLDEAAALLKVNPATIRRRIKKGKLPGAVIRPDEGVLGVRERYFIPRSALQTPFEVKDVVPVERGLSVDNFITAIDIHLRTQLSKQRQDILEAVEQAFKEQAEQQSEREQRTTRLLQQTLKERFEQQDELIEELTAQVAVLNKPFWTRLRRKPRKGKNEDGG